MLNVLTWHSRIIHEHKTLRVSIRMAAPGGTRNNPIGIIPFEQRIGKPKAPMTD